MENNLEYNAIKDILIKLGYEKSGVKIKDGVLKSVERYLRNEKIDTDNLSYINNDYRKIGVLYKYFYLKSNKQTRSKVGLLDINDDGHYSTQFWKYIEEEVMMSKDKFTFNI